ncbi:MAG: glycosyltransferase family 2 protein [Hyphomonadaceae bacterium]
MAQRAGIIVVTYNSRAFFPRLKAALEAQTAPYDLIVWDNASAPAQRPLAEDVPAGARLVQSEENLGFAVANNRAAAMLECEFIVLLNPDAFPELDWLAELIAAAERYPRAAAFGSTQIDAMDETRFDGLGDCYHAAGIPWRGGYGLARGDAAPREGETFSPCAAAALYRADAWRAAGGFDESFFCYCEDVDLGFRLRLAGHAVMQAPRAIVAHVGGGSSSKRSDFAVFYGTRNRLWTFVKDMPPALFWALLPAHAAMTCAFLCVSPFRGTGKATWRGVAAGLKGLPAIWRARRTLQRQRKTSLAALARALAWSPRAMLRRQPVIRDIA